MLVAPMLRGNRELIAGLHHDPQFGMTVMLGVGGVLAEAVGRRRVPARAASSRVDAEEMIDDLATQALLGPFRGEPAVDRDALADVLLGLSAAAEADPTIVVGRPQPADRRRRPAGRRRRARRGRRVTRRPTDARSGRCSTRGA